MLVAGVAQHGQRRRTEAPIPKGFVGSNPTPRTRFSEIVFKFDVLFTANCLRLRSPVCFQWSSSRYPGAFVFADMVLISPGMRGCCSRFFCLVTFYGWFGLSLSINMCCFEWGILLSFEKSIKRMEETTMSRTYSYKVLIMSLRLMKTMPGSSG